IRAIRPLTPAQLALDGGIPAWPIWAIVGHTAGTRPYWLCSVFGEPGAEATPFPNSANEPGWEDDLSHPRSADELIGALETTWAIVEAVLERWTSDMLDEPFRREIHGKIQHHTRQSVLMRMISHDAYHAGELSQILGAADLVQVDLWPPQGATDAGDEAGA
ncbi:MAG TPA: DinB family protein, partial [Candidatus Limnocylindrales bacterium]|nr:DinB family protein [Candidatus Limnocylindrales bacterium]